MLEIKQGVPEVTIKIYCDDMKYQIKSELGDYNSDLLSVTTNKSLASPSGTFSITFVPRLDNNSRTWFNKLDAFDYVEIAFKGIEDSDSQVVMRGIIDSVNKSEDYSSGQPRRSIVVSGRDLGSLLESQQIYYIPEIGKQEAMQSYLKVLAWKKFFPVSVNAYEAFKFISERLEECIKVSYNNIELSKRFGFTAASMFDDDRSNLFHLMGYEGPFWNAYQQYQDKPFHEIFVYDAPDKAWLVMRPSRFKDAMGDYHVSVNAVTQFKRMSQSLSREALLGKFWGQQGLVDELKTFENSRAASLVYPSGIKISATDKINLAVSKMHDEVFNYYLTIPALMMLSKVEFRGVCLSANKGKPEESENPFFQIDPKFPAYIGKFGFRKLEATTYFVNLEHGQLGVDDNGRPTRGQDYESKIVKAPKFLQKMIQRNRILVAWFLHNQYLLRGTMSIRGTNSALIGTYVEDTDENMEYYIESVNHQFVLFDSFKTTLGLTRGQPPTRSKGLVGLGKEDARFKYETLNAFYFSGTGTKSVYRDVDIKISNKTKATPKANAPTSKRKMTRQELNVTIRDAAQDYVQISKQVPASCHSTGGTDFEKQYVPLLGTTIDAFVKYMPGGTPTDDDVPASTGGIQMFKPKAGTKAVFNINEGR